MSYIYGQQTQYQIRIILLIKKSVWSQGGVAKGCEYYLETFDDFADGPSGENFFHFLIDPTEKKATDWPLGS
jgi:hypothetical protein